MYSPKNDSSLPQEPSEDFPFVDLVPKKETEAANFLKLNPQFDGRGVLMAIIDTGVDPLAKGLQVTSDGRPKIVDCIDTSGSGDVDTSTRVTPNSPDSDGDNDGGGDGCFITGLTGRTLRIPSTWTNPSNSYAIGCKNVFDLYYPSTKKRVMDKRKQMYWDTPHNQTIASIKKRLNEMEAQENSENGNKNFSKLEREDLNSQLKVLESLERKFPDQGPVVDVITWNDGTKGQPCEGNSGVVRSGWCVCVDTSFSGDLASCKVLRPFKEEFDVCSLSEECLCNFSVCVYGDNAETTVLVTTGSSHGTHVASIASSFRLDDVNLNGVAPGAQIISIKIGDSRLFTMESGTSMTRAMDYCNRNNVDIANYSFGEPAAFESSGRIIESIERSIHNFNLCFFSSHGNNGPGLRTGSSPGNTCNGGFGVTAYLSPAMRKAQCMLDNPNCASEHYFWSSRGPCMDGKLGVSLCAPGAAFTSVAQTSHKGEELMNGTSMASPNAAGCMALILSGLKSSGIQYSPYSLERSISTTCAPLSNNCPFASGVGAIQTLKAFEHIIEHSSVYSILNQLFFKVTTSQGSKRGVILHRECDFVKPCRPYITVETNFRDVVSSEEKCLFSLSLSLVSSQSWVSVPTFLYITNTSRGFYITIDTSHLKPGAHFAEILAYDSTNVKYGPVFRFPITVLKPLNESSLDTEFVFDSIHLTPGALVRKFLRPPEGSSFATVKLTSLSSQFACRLCLHCLPFKQCSPYSADSQRKHVLLECSESKSFTYPVEPGLLWEVCVAQMNTWSVDCFVKVQVSFHGIVPSCDTFSMHHFGPPYRIDVRCLLNRAVVEPSATLNHLAIPLRPSEYRIIPLSTSSSDRDCFILNSPPDTTNSNPPSLCHHPTGQDEGVSPSHCRDKTVAATQDIGSSDCSGADSGRDPDSGSGCEVIYGLELTYHYNHNVKEKEVYPECPLLSCLLYESVLDSQMWFLYDCNKQLMGCGDFQARKYSCTLEKGEYCIKLWIRHPKYDVLEKLQSLQFVVRRKVQNVALSFYTTPNTSFKSTGLSKGSSTHMFILPIPEDKLPKPGVPGSFLSGKISFIGDEPGKSCNTYPFTYFIGPPPVVPSNSKKESTGSKSGGHKEKEKSFEDFMRESRMAFIQKKTDLPEEEVVKLYQELLAEFPKQLNIHIAFTSYLGTGPVSRQKKYRSLIISICNAAISQIDQKEILMYFGCHKDGRDELTRNKKKPKLKLEKKEDQTLTSLEREAEKDEQTNEKSFEIEASSCTPFSPSSSCVVEETNAAEDKSEAVTFVLDGKEIETQKNQLIELLQRKCLALLLSSEDENNHQMEEEKRCEEIEQCWKCLKQLTDPMTDHKTFQLALKYCRHKKLYGLVCAKLLLDYEDSSLKSKTALNNFKDSLKDLQWNHAVDRIQNSTLLVRYPPSFVPY